MKLKKTLVLGITVAMAMWAFSQVWADEALGITIYADGNYSGRSANLDQGRYDITQLGIPNDQVSSVKVHKCFTATLYADAGFKGQSIKVTSNRSFLSEFNDQTSSIVVEFKGCSSECPCGGP